MKRTLTAIILTLCLTVSVCAGAEGILPSLTDTIGKSMPSLGEALGRYPEEEIPGDDGSNTEVFRGVTETDFNTFSLYLSEQGAVLADYQVNGTTFSASIQVDGRTISFTYDTQTLEASVTYPKRTYDEWLDYAKTRFESAIQLMDMGKTEEAFAALTAIPNYSGYGPAAGYMEAHPELAAAAARLKSFKTVGSYVTFGHYPQTAGGKDKTPIEWEVLDYDAKNNRTLLISRYGLDAQPYNKERIEITWEKCTLRTWLNGTFLNKAFTEVEQKGIVLTEVDNSASQEYSEWRTKGGSKTQDRVFLLSYGEANKYLGVTYDDRKNTRSRAAPTAYAVKKGAITSGSDKTADGTAAGWWWLRSPGYLQLYAAFVFTVGSLFNYDVNLDSGCVRPALWIDLNADIF